MDVTTRTRCGLLRLANTDPAACVCARMAILRPTFPSLLALVVPIIAQDATPGPKPPVETEKLWKVESSGLGG